MKKTMLYMIICLLCVSLANAQNNNPLNNSPDKDTIQEVFVDSVIHPKFPGGDEALMQYLSENLVYPPTIQDRRFKGKVLVQFVVETDGSISNVEVVRSLYKDLDEEVVRVIKNMPKWIPAKQDGKAIREYYKLPISFELADNSTTTDSSSNNTIQEENERVFATDGPFPEFPGGEEAFIQYLNENLVYPKSAFERKIEGKVVVGFDVEADGSITNVKVANSVDEDLDEEAVRVIKNMPKWIPAKQDGKAIREYYKLPISFELADNSTTTDSSSNNTIQEENERVFVEVEQLPEFPGGKKAFIQYLNENLVYPKSAYERKVEGKVVVSFVVEADGSITNVKVANSVDEDLDKEAVRVVKAMPKWIPGKHKGKAVPVLFRCLPINFQL